MSSATQPLNCHQQTANPTPPTTIRKKSKSSTCLTVFTIFLTIITLILVLVLSIIVSNVFVPSSQKLNKSKCSGQFCTTSICLDISTELTRNMDMTANPCEDFVSFACGGYQKRNWFDSKSVHSGLSTLKDMSRQLTRRIFEMLYLNGTLPTNELQTKKLYNFARLTFRKCMKWHQNYWKNRPKYREMFNSYFLYITEDIHTNNVNNLEKFLATLVLFGEGRLFDVTAFERDITQRIDLQINQTKILIKTANFEFTKPWELQVIQQVVNFFKSENIVAFNLLNLNFDLPKLVKLHNEIMSLISRNRGFRRGIVWNGSLHELNYQFSSIMFDWAKFFRYVFNKDLPPNTQLSVMNMDVLKDLLTIYSKMSTSVDRYPTELSLLLLHTVLSLIDFYPPKLKEVLKTLASRNRREFGVNILSGTDSERMYGSSCLLSTIESYSPITTKLYRQMYIPYSLKDIHKIVEQLKYAMVENVDNSAWISPSSKKSVIKKIRSLRRFIGYQELSTQDLSQFYSDLLNVFGESTFGYGKMYGIKQKLLKKRILQLLISNDVVSYFYFMNPLEVNAMNFQSANSVVFPLGILAPFLYHPKYPYYLKFGGIGFVVGHEIGHSFDIAGHEVGDDLFDKQTETNFQQRVNCVLKRYSGYTLDNGLQFNPNNTVGNDIADLIGLNSAYAAYKIYKERNASNEIDKVRLPGVLSHFNEDQLFFIQFAQSWCERYTIQAYTSVYGTSKHSPGQLRIKGSLQNTPSFAAAFQCPPTSSMNPRDKCTFW